MQILLDYYRILGVPIQVTDEQLSQAFQDRVLQKPRREYSDLAIKVRQQLIDHAYQYLSDAHQRAEYDLQFFLTNKPSSENLEEDIESIEQIANIQDQPFIEINPDQLLGVLIILQEVGEYELVLELGEPYLNQLENSSKNSAYDVEIIKADVLLTMALACLELGREYWQQGEYEQAADYGQQGQNLLTKEGLFPKLQTEIQSDIYKLRPYRILELLALEETQIQQRQKGLKLLREMLNERQGIDGKGDDQSGLGVDDFLRFIQQIRNYLTVFEQQELFEVEAQRPSAVATYLAVYALLARGFAERQPALIVRAKESLRRLSKRQDVYLEQAICSMLLGQTQEASLALEKSQDQETLAFIEEHSQGAPDLLPGLCLYGERWLQTEVFAQYRNLVNYKTSLKEYFADEQVQNYLEHLSVEIQSENLSLDEADVIKLPPTSYPIKPQNILDDNEEIPEEIEAFPAQNYLNDVETFSDFSPEEEDNYPLNNELLITDEQNYSPPKLTLVEPSESSKIDVAHNNLKPTDSVAISPKIKKKKKPKNSINLGNYLKFIPKINNKFSPNKKNQYLPFILIFILLGIGLIFGIYKIAKGEEELAISLNQPVVKIPKLETNNNDLDISGSLNQQKAQNVINRWLRVKNEALGRKHQINTLDKILLPPILNYWSNYAKELKQSNSYWHYQHPVLVIESVSINKPNSNQAIVKAKIREIGQFYQGGKLDKNKSYDSTLRIQYQLIQQNNSWLIKDTKVL